MCRNICSYVHSKSTYVYYHCTDIKFHLPLYVSVNIQYTKEKIRKLLAIEDEKRKTQQDLLSSSKEDADDSVDTTQGKATQSKMFVSGPANFQSLTRQPGFLFFT